MLIEDVTAFTGVNVALLNVLTTEHTGMYETQELCRISSIVGTTEKYFSVNFMNNHKDRVTQFFCIPNDVFGENPDSLYEFVGRYLNAMSLRSDTLEDWARNGASIKDYPVHKGEEKAIRDNFPEFAIERINDIPFENLYVSTYIHRHVNENSADRVERFVRVWGDASDLEYEENDVKYVGGMPVAFYEDLGIPCFEGRKGGKKTVVPQQMKSKDVLNITKARDEINKHFLISAINWQVEGVSLDNLNRVKNTKDFIGFERQKRGIQNALLILPANRETQELLEAFLAYVTLGNGSWNFDNSV